MVVFMKFQYFEVGLLYTVQSVLRSTIVNNVIRYSLMKNKIDYTFSCPDCISFNQTLIKEGGGVLFN